MRVTFGICFKEHFDTRYLAFCNLSSPRMLLPLALLSEYRIQHGAIGPLYITSSYSTWIFCRGILSFATDCPCGVWVSWINHLPPVCWSTFWKSTFKQQLGYRFDIIDCKSSFFCILTYAIVHVLIHHMLFRLYLYFLNSVLYFYLLLLY